MMETQECKSRCWRVNRFCLDILKCWKKWNMSMNNEEFYKKEMEKMFCCFLRAWEKGILRCFLWFMYHEKILFPSFWTSCIRYSQIPLDIHQYSQMIYSIHSKSRLLKLLILDIFSIPRKSWNVILNCPLEKFYVYLKMVGWNTKYQIGSYKTFQ